MVKSTLLSLLAIISTLIASGLSQENAISFYGGQHQEVVPDDEQDSFSIRFQFRTVQDSGILLVATLQAMSDYVAIVLQSGSQLQVVLGQAGETSTLGSVTFPEADLLGWQAVQVSVANGTLTAQLQEITFLEYTFTAPVGVSRLHLGGPQSFSEQPLPLPHSYVGCLADISLDSRAVLVADSDGVRAGCCIAPRYPMWCLNSTLSSLTVSSQHSTSDQLSLSFRLRQHSTVDGLVMLGHSPSSLWTVRLHEGRLRVGVNVSGHVETVDCPATLHDEWHQIDIFLDASRIECDVDGIVQTTAVELAGLLFPGTLQLGGSPDAPNGPGFRGCFQRLRLNGADVGVNLLSAGESTVAGVLPSVSWSEFESNSSGLLVTKGMSETLSTTNIMIHLPRDMFADDLNSRYELELENAVHFEVESGPHYGHLFLGQVAVSVQSFDYSNILSADPAHQVGYVHNGQDNLTDVVVLRVWAGCGDTLLAELGQLSLLISLEEPDEGPRVRPSQGVFLAVGTRRVLTPEILTVEDPSQPDPVQILFNVQSVTLQDSPCDVCVGIACDECEREEGGIIIKNGVSIKFFNQDEINRGQISFQHFERFSTSPMLIQLGATVSAHNAHANIDVTIPVTLYQGHINLTSSPQSCLFVREQEMALLRPNHLKAVTDFEDQAPVLTYDLLTLPVFGILQRYEAAVSEWVDVSNSTSAHATPFGGTSSSTFTQTDIDEGHVRYIQSEPYSVVDIETFQFRLRSYNLSGPTGNLCIDVVPDELAPQPSINVELSELVMMEDGTAAVNQTVLNTTLTLDDFHYILQEPDPLVDLQQLEVLFTLVDPPSYGGLELRGEILVAGDVFTYSDVTSNALIYVHGDSEDHLDHFTFYAEAGSTAYLPIRAPNLTSNLTLVINITAVNDHTPVMVVESLESIRPPEGCWVTITSKNINVTDEDRPPENLTIFARKKGDTPNGIFAFREEPDLPVVRFLMQDVLNDRVLFVHKLNLSASLNYTQVLKIDDGHPEHVIRRPISITAIPLSLAVSVPPNLDCIATIDAGEGSLEVQLDASLFTATLSDHFGNNANLVPEIKVDVEDYPDHGQLLLAAEDTTENQIFSPSLQIRFHDVGRVIYSLEEQSRSESADDFTLQFQYGHSTPVVLTLTVCIQPALVPLSLQLSSLEVKFGGVARITTQHLAVTSSREEDKGTLTFHVVGTGPQHGVLLNEHSDNMDHSLTEFSHDDVTDGVIVYEYRSNSAHTQDSVELMVCSELHCLQQQTLDIVIHPITLTVQNASIHILEGDLYQFSLSDFNISAPPHYIITLVPHQQPEHGELLILLNTYIIVTHFNLEDIKYGRVYYNNSKSEELFDNFEVSIHARNQQTETEMNLDFIMKIYIEPVNNHDPEVVTNNDLTVVRGGTALITSSTLSAHDYDVGSDDNDLIWTIPDFLPILGYLYLVDEPDTPVHSWTEGDIRMNRLYYRNTETQNTIDVLVPTVSDGERFASAHFLVEIVLVDIKNCSNLVPFSVMEGGSDTITYQHLRYHADNDDSLSDSSFVITIRRLPLHGILTLNNQQLHVNDAFTQDKIATDQLIYSHDHSNSIKDNFTFELSVPDRQDHFVNETFSMHIVPIDDDPPVAILSNPMFVVELQRVRIDDEILSIVDIDSQTKVEKDRVVCELVQPLTKGRLEKLRFEHINNHTLNFTKFDLESGNLWYHHLSSPDLSQDQLVFNLTDGVNRQTEIYNLTIIVLPQKVSLRLGRLAVSENDMAFITFEEIMVSHPYLRTVGGVITLEEGSGPRHGELVSIQAGNVTHDLRTFTTEDMSNRLIAYNHSGVESLVDSFQFQYEAREPAHYNRRSDFVTLYIDIAPVNDQLPMIADNMTTLRIWATDTVFLDENYFNVTDHDTGPNKLNFTFQILSLGGYITFANDTSTPIFWFTQADIYAHTVKFRHYDGPMGTLAYNVTDGVHIASGNISIFADILALECDTNQWRSIQVDFLGSTNVTSSNMYCTFSDGGTEREVNYRVSNTRLGHFEVDSETRREFTSSEIGAGLVRYVHTETGYWRENETLVISVSSPPAFPEDNLPLHVIVHYPQPSGDSQLAVNTGLYISEGGSQCIDESVLDGRNLRYAAWMLQSNALEPADLSVRYEVVGMPSHGNLTLEGRLTNTFTQADLAQGTLQYSHDDSETLLDHVVMSVSVRSEAGTVVLGPHQEQLVVTICPQNDQPPGLQSTLLEKTLVEEFNTPLLTTDLQVVDEDSPPEQLLFTLLTLPNNTHLSLNGSTLTVNDTFSQEAINRQWITFEPFEPGTSNFSFVFTDGVQASQERSEFVLTVEKHYLHLVHFEELTYLQNETLGTLITTSHLDTATNGHRSQTTFTVQLPHFGRIMMRDGVMGDREVHVHSFTQVDVDNHRVKYVPLKATHHHKDNFSLNISNTDLHLSREMHVRILAWGQTSQTGFVDFNLDPDNLVQPLPRDVIVLTELEREISQPPYIEVQGPLTFGHLEMRVEIPEVSSVSKRFAEEIVRFRYDELQQGWIVYVWDYVQPLSNLSVTESFPVLVLAEGLQPGEAVITFTVSPPHDHTASPPTRPATPTAASTTAGSTGNKQSSTLASGSGSVFPVYTLVPIIGIIFFLILLIVIVVIFCLTQQKKIKKKWVPSIVQPRHPSPPPWAAQTPQVPLQVTHYDYDPSAMPIGESDHHNSDTSSGFSEPDCSPRQTPIRSIYSPHPFSPPYQPHPSRSRMRRSNVSITFSSRQSTTSEMSLDDDDDGILHSSVSQYPPHRASTTTPIPLPIRPASHAAFNRPPASAVPLDSGIASLNSRTIQQSSQTLDAEASDSKPLPSSLQQDYSTKEELSEWAADNALPDLNDPNVQKLFYAHDPVLKKEEYWV